MHLWSTTFKTFAHCFEFDWFYFLPFTEALFCLGPDELGNLGDKDNPGAKVCKLM